MASHARDLARGVRVQLNEAVVDLETGDVHAPIGGSRRLQYQPLLVLRALVDRAGLVVTREELRRTVWAADTFVDFEHGLNYCVRQLRVALGDDARSPRFVETIPRRGYRLVATVSISPTPTDADRHVETSRTSRRVPRRPGLVWAGSLATVVGVLLLGLARDTGPAVSRTPAPLTSTVAWDAFVRARGLLARGSGHDIDTALHLLDQAIAADGTFAAAHAARADALVFAAVRGLRPARATFDQAERAVHTALALEPDAPAAIATWATIRFRRYWDWDGAERLFVRARAAPGGGAAVFRDHAWFLAARGRGAEAVAAMREALALDPTSARISSEAAWILTRARAYDEAIDQVGRALALSPTLRGLHACLECAYVHTGRFADAVDAIKSSAPPGTSFLGLPHDPRQALARLERHRLEAILRERHEDPAVSAYVVAVQAAAAGDDRGATDWLERALRERDPGLTMIVADPIWDRLRDDQTVAHVTRAVGLTTRRPTIVAIGTN